MPEYGLGSEVSVKGDMYSYGILVLELMTGKRPTDPMFQEGLNLHKYTNISIPNHVAEFLDPTFLHHFKREKSSTSDGTNQRARQANHGNRTEDCFVIGVACSMDSPKDRMDIADVLTELHLISSIIERETSTGCARTRSILE